MPGQLADLVVAKSRRPTRRCTRPGPASLQPWRAAVWCRSVVAVGRTFGGRWAAQVSAEPIGRTMRSIVTAAAILAAWMPHRCRIASNVVQPTLCVEPELLAPSDGDEHPACSRCHADSRARLRHSVQGSRAAQVIHCRPIRWWLARPCTRNCVWLGHLTSTPQSRLRSHGRGGFWASSKGLPLAPFLVSPGLIVLRQGNDCLDALVGTGALDKGVGMGWSRGVPRRRRRPRRRLSRRHRGARTVELNAPTMAGRFSRRRN